jgi:hypothetical protein
MAMMAVNPSLLEEVLEEYSQVHGVDLLDLPLGEVKNVLTVSEWEVVHDVIKYGKDKRKYH